MLTTNTYSTLQWNATDSMPAVHTDHHDGRYSVRLTDEHDAVAVYVVGTPAELTDLAARLAGAALVAGALTDAANGKALTS